MLSTSGYRPVANVGAAEVGWSEQYWEDVRLELEEPAAALAPTAEEEAPDLPTTGLSGDAIEDDAPVSRSSIPLMAANSSRISPCD